MITLTRMNMKNTSTLIAVFLVLFFTGNAQTWVQVPDVEFQEFLSNNFPNAVTTTGGNFYIDQDHQDVTGTAYLNISGRSMVNLIGINAFVNLDSLKCVYNLNLTSLGELPTGLQRLACSSNDLTSLPDLPAGLLFLDCSNNDLTTIPDLPVGLEILSCSSNHLIALPDLPAGLQRLNCNVNQLTAIPDLPVSLQRLECSHNQLTALPDLHVGLQYLNCNNNQFTSLTDLPVGLAYLSCNYNQLTSLPALPSGLEVLYCYDNLLTTIPDLPVGMIDLLCGYNQITTLPEFPEGFEYLDCYSNQISCFPFFPSSVTGLALGDNPFTCLPNYVAGMSSATLAYPLCFENDAVNNPNACPSTYGIIGSVFQDVNDDCVNSGVNDLRNVPILLLDNASNPISSTLSLTNGFYQFVLDPGGYKVQVDNSNLTLGLQSICPPSNEYSVNLTNAAANSTGNDFGIQCTGFDLGIQSVFTNGWVFPGKTHVATVEAGDLSTYFGLDCAEGISGEIAITVSGPGDVIDFQGLPSSSSGNSAVYSVGNFGGFLSDFKVLIKTDTTAQTGDQYCITVTIFTTDLGELEVNNNDYVFCYDVVNSYDPNIKQTTPEIITPDYEDEFTYTIYFQNTGSAPAFNVRLEDVLDSSLNLSTFKVVNASHEHHVTLDFVTRKLIVRYPDIMLADSTSDPEGSIGFVQYRIKPIAGLQEGTIIENTAAIYFDFNAPIFTNTTQNIVANTWGIKALKTNNTVSLFPNPANEQISIRSEDLIESIEIYSSNGNLYYTLRHLESNVSTLDLRKLPAGIYLTKIVFKNGVSTARFIKK